MILENIDSINLIEGAYYLIKLINYPSLDACSDSGYCIAVCRCQREYHFPIIETILLEEEETGRHIICNDIIGLIKLT